MALLLSQQSPVSSADLSDDYSSNESIAYGTMASSAAPSVSPKGNLKDCDKYSDDDIRLLYAIVIRAEEILSELTPSSRLPTHALFKAYDEILPAHGIDPDDDQLISELVFKVGGVKDTSSLREKFKIAMARLEITVQEDPSPIYESDAGDAHANAAYASDELSISDHEDHRFIVSNNAPQKLPGGVSGKHIGDGHIVAKNQHGRQVDNVDDNISNEENPANLSKIEQHLECSAIAFQKKHHNKFTAVTALRQWQKKSNYISTLCDQFDAARQADQEEDVEAKFEAWRAIAAEVNNLPPQDVPPNVYSKRIEAIARRAREIHNARTTLRHWRQNARHQSRKVQKIEESSDPLERVAAKAHKNLLLSRAFVNWSNRLEEESERAEMAAKVYEMRLKSKAFGIRRHPTDKTRVSGSHDSHVDTPPPANPTSIDDAPKHPLSERVESNVVGDYAGPSSAVTEAPKRVSSEVPEKSLSSHEEFAEFGDEMDETTLLARRHILRMRYYDAWETYTADKLSKVRDFRAMQQDERMVHTIPLWRCHAEQITQERETLRYNAERANYYNKAIKALDVWRQGSQEKLQEEDRVLKDYAARANFYYKATETLPIWRNETACAVKQQGVLELYANRAEYFYKATKTLPIWRTQAQQISEHEEQILARYAERADYYYRTRETLLSWHDLAKQKRKQRLKDAHLETRRIVKKGMGQRCIAQWREKLQPSFERYETMNVILEDVVADREWRQTTATLDTWRERTREQNEMGIMSDAMVKGKLLEQWRDWSAYREELRTEAEEHCKETNLSRVLKNWNLSSLQIPNRPLMVANALEKKDRRLLRTSFEVWYSRTADKLVPVELPDGSYKSVQRVVEDVQHQASLTRARGLFDKWKSAAKGKSESAQQETYTPTPGRPRLFLGSLGRREPTTPLAPVPSQLNWRASETALRSSAMRGRANRSGRPERNLRVSWAQ
ncbi:hypothetical protein F5Y05DRAFT_395222 [Hypoxylon sp. FL0543]|nr:hypothetical protein F5Y05DRAFT_395222 [Hypoxylon sp. FL0543]